MSLPRNETIKILLEQGEKLLKDSKEFLPKKGFLGLFSQKNDANSGAPKQEILRTTKDYFRMEDIIRKMGEAITKLEKETNNPKCNALLKQLKEREPFLREKYEKEYKEFENTLTKRERSNATDQAPQSDNAPQEKQSSDGSHKLGR